MEGRIYRDQGAGFTTRHDNYPVIDVTASYEINENLNASLKRNNVTEERYLASLNSPL